MKAEATVISKNWKVPTLKDPPLIRAHWPMEQALSLGNLLIFRQELELLARIHNAREIHIYFEVKNGALPHYFNDALLSRIPIRCFFSPCLTEKIDWPPNETQVGQWPYSSLKRVSLLKEISAIFPVLLWPSEIVKIAEQKYLALKPKPTIAIHLKQQKGGREESNADLREWEEIFKENHDKIFVLLGIDKMPEWITALPNIRTSLQLKMSLPVQLAFCAVVDAFLGMASGICPGAFFSSIPYVIFKHPAHHSEEMQEEIGSADHFPFALESQKLWRKPDDRNHLRAAIQLVGNGKWREK